MRRHVERERCDGAVVSATILDLPLGDASGWLQVEDCELAKLNACQSITPDLCANPNALNVYQGCCSLQLVRRDGSLVIEDDQTCVYR